MGAIPTIITVTSGTTILAATENSNNTAFRNMFDPAAVGIDFQNVTDDGLTEVKMDRNASVAVFYAETLAPSAGFIESGLTFASSSGLFVTFVAGTAFASRTSTAPNAFIRRRKTTSLTTPVLTATSDNYIDYNTNTDTFIITPQSIGGLPPALATDTTRLLRAVTDATTVTSTTDLRNLNFFTNVGVSEHDIDDLRLERTSTTTATLTPGHADVGGTILTSTSDIVINPITAIYLAGAAAANTIVNLYINDNGSAGITLQPSTDDPNISDVNDNTDGLLRYRKYAGTLHRYVGRIRLDASTLVTDFVWEGGDPKEPFVRWNLDGDDSENQTGFEVADNISNAAFTDVDTSPAIGFNTSRIVVQQGSVSVSSNMFVRNNGGPPWGKRHGEGTGNIVTEEEVWVDSAGIYESKNTNTIDILVVAYWDKR